MSDRLPPREWKYAPSYIGHILQGSLMALGIMWGGVWRLWALAAMVWTIAYQSLEFARRRDTPARDLNDYMIGFGGLVAIVWWVLWTFSRQK